MILFPLNLNKPDNAYLHTKGYNLARIKKQLIFLALPNEVMGTFVKLFQLLDQYKVNQGVYEMKNLTDVLKQWVCGN